MNKLLTAVKGFRDLGFSAVAPYLLAIAGIVILVGVIVILMQRADIALQKRNVAQCQLKHTQHLNEDEKARVVALERQRHKEDADEQRRNEIERAGEAERRALQDRIDARDRDLAAGKLRLHDSLVSCSRSLRHAVEGAAPSPSGEDAASDGRRRVSRAIGHAGSCDGDYAELLSIAKSDRKAVGVRP